MEERKVTLGVPLMNLGITELMSIVKWLSFYVTKFGVAYCTVIACFYVYKTFQEEGNKANNLGSFLGRDRRSRAEKRLSFRGMLFHTISIFLFPCTCITGFFKYVFFKKDMC